MEKNNLLLASKPKFLSRLRFSSPPGTIINEARIN